MIVLPSLSLQSSNVGLDLMSPFKELPSHFLIVR
jgi:hypothetical protein